MANKTTPDLDVMTVPELNALIEAAEAKRAAKLEEAKAALMAEFRERAAALGMSVSDLRAPQRAMPERKSRVEAKAPAVVKFRGPNGATWSGRGRKPHWLTGLEAQGKKAEDFRV